MTDGELAEAVRYEKAKPKWNWRNFLTDAEAETIIRADKAKREWRLLNKERAAITNRAIQRAKNHAKRISQ